ncbi:MAG TPA: hypothetical protein VIQ55_09985 [Burkholderiales bacterium]
MASIPHPQHSATSPHHERRTGERRHGFYAALLRGEGSKVSWGGIFGGVLVAVGLLFLLAALGVAVGITAADPGQTQASTLGTGAGIWTGLSLLIALFVGGMVSTRTGAITDRTTGLFEGALVWVVSMLAVVYFASSGVSLIAGGATRLVGGATQAGTSVMQGGGANVDMSGSVDQVIQRLNDPKTAQQIASATGMQQSEVQSALGDTAQRVEQNRNEPAKAAAEAKGGMSQLMEKAKSSGALEQKAEQVQPQASRAAWLTFGALLLSLLAAVIGAMSGRREPKAHVAK